MAEDRHVYGEVESAQTREGYEAEREGTKYEVEPTTSHFTQIVEVPGNAENVEFRGSDLPERYRSALQDVS